MSFCVPLIRCPMVSKVTGKRTDSPGAPLTVPPRSSAGSVAAVGVGLGVDWGSGVNGGSGVAGTQQTPSTHVPELHSPSSAHGVTTIAPSIPVTSATRLPRGVPMITLLNLNEMVPVAAGETSTLHV